MIDESAWGELEVWLQQVGRPLGPKEGGLLRSYCQMLYAASEKTNLTAKADREQLPARHILPSLNIGLILSMVPHRRVLDFGSGAGIPAIPLKILFPESDFILVESRRRRANFIREVIRRLGLERIEVRNCRIEDLYPELEGQMDVVTARAATTLENLRGCVATVLGGHGTIITTLDPSRGYGMGEPLLIRNTVAAIGQKTCVTAI